MNTKKTTTNKVNFLHKLLQVIKSFHLWAWAIFTGGTIYAYKHSEIMKGDYSELDRSIQGMEDFFIWLMCVEIWMFVYLILVNIWLKSDNSAL